MSRPEHQFAETIQNDIKEKTIDANIRQMLADKLQSLAIAYKKPQLKGPVSSSVSLALLVHNDNIIINGNDPTRLPQMVLKTFLHDHLNPIIDLAKDEIKHPTGVMSGGPNGPQRGEAEKVLEHVLYMKWLIEDGPNLKEDAIKGYWKATSFQRKHEIERMVEQSLKTKKEELQEELSSLSQGFSKEKESILNEHQNELKNKTQEFEEKIRELELQLKQQKIDYEHALEDKERELQHKHEEESKRDKEKINELMQKNVRLEEKIAGKEELIAADKEWRQTLTGETGVLKTIEDNIVRRMTTSGGQPKLEPVGDSRNVSPSFQGNGLFSRASTTSKSETGKDSSNDLAALYSSTRLDILKTIRDLVPTKPALKQHFHAMLVNPHILLSELFNDKSLINFSNALDGISAKDTILAMLKKESPSSTIKHKTRVSNMQQVERAQKIITAFCEEKFIEAPTYQLPEIFKRNINTFK